jgi:beta-fructofuranosidase
MTLTSDGPRRGRVARRAARAALWVSMLALAPACTGAEAADPALPRTGSRLELSAWTWLFNSSEPAHSTLTAQAPQAEFAAPAEATRGFTVTFTVDLKTFDGRKNILDVPNVLNVRLQQGPLDRGGQNYPSFRMPDGSVPVLEATVVLHSVEHPDWKNLTLGIPLAMLRKPEGEHDVVLDFTGANWVMYVDGELLDNNYAFGVPRWADRNAWKLDAEYVKTAAIHLPGIKPEKKQAKTPGISPGIQYWTPPGHNNWVGDVATLFHRGRYHVFYLYDRRHYGSKFGCGGHYFEHLSTADFRTWTEHEAATPIEEPWETIGTGTPFVFKDQLCLSYGLHTTRIYPQDKTTLPALWDYLKKNGRTGEFKRDTTPGVPAGSTYAVSADGVSHFRKSGVLFHPCENPSVYIDPGGKLRMMANYRSNGIWESESLDGGWRCVSPGFPPGGDCTFFFRWGRYDYIIGGFTGLWSKPADAPDYVDVVRKGLDFYDGSNVPAISGIADGRFLMAAWIPIRGWGGNLVIRELVQFPDGRIGSKWMREITPETAAPSVLAAKVAGTTAFPADSRSFLLAFNVHPAEAKKGRFGISFLPENGEKPSCELQVRLEGARAQFGPGSQDRFGGDEKSLREGGAPQQAGNYAIENLIGVDKPFAVRVLVKGCDKIGGSLVDAEIAGQRTMISFRPDLTVKRMVIRTEGVELRDVRMSALKN